MNSEQSEPTQGCESPDTLTQTQSQALRCFTNRLNELFSLNYLYRISTQVMLEEYADLGKPIKDKLIFGLNLNIEYLEELEDKLKDQLQQIRDEGT